MERTTEISFKPLVYGHLPTLQQWLESPHVKAYWDRDIDWTDQLILDKYGTYIEGYKMVDGIKLPLEAFIIYLGSLPIGYLQLYDARLFPRDNYDLNHLLSKTSFGKSKMAAIDIFLGDVNVIGKGIGSFAMRRFLDEHVWKCFECCLVDPDKDNIRAIKAYEKAGFVSTQDTPNDKSVIMVASK